MIAIVRRYDAVVHLVTAAIGAEKFYTTENNTARWVIAWIYITLYGN